LEVGAAPVYEGTTFVSLRALAEALCPGAEVSWEEDRAVVRYGDMTLSAQPGDTALLYNNERMELGVPIRFEDWRTLVPLRPLCALLGVEVTWDASTGAVALTRSQETTYSQEDLYWLSRIISAESQGESWEGKIAVGNVVLNRVASADFPNTIYDVIFDDRWGGQFAPVRNGTIYDEPTEESVQAAIACLAGANTVGDSLYFLAPDLTSDHWTMDNRTYVTTIGAHWFYE
jgi:N-acetylmuramoyl-L-alanine amidase